MAKIFISYRRDDSKQIAVHLRERLTASFGDGAVFLDLSELPAGHPFPEQIGKALESCPIFFALIGSRWLGDQNTTWRLGRRFRIQKKDDWIRHEIAQALRFGKFILPILIDGGRMPAKRMLPREIQAFGDIQAVNLRAESFTRDYETLETELWRRLHDQYGVSEYVARKYHAVPARDFFTRFAGPEVNYLNQGWRLDRLAVGIGFTNATLNRWLCTSKPTIPIDISSQSWLAVERYGRDLRSFVVSRAIRRSFVMANESKIRIASKIDMGAASSIRLQKTDYESSLMTDQIVQELIASNDLGEDGHSPRRVIWDGIDKFTVIDKSSGHIQVLDFSDTGTSNQFGGSTLAFTRDGYLLVVMGNELNLQSARMLAPSGSGSFDWDDIGSARDLLAVAIAGAGRELREECSLMSSFFGERDIAFNLWPIAFTRMLHRGGKPEIYFLAFVDAKLSELIHRKRERYVAAVVPAVNVRQIDWSREPVAPAIQRACGEYLRQLGSLDSVQVSAPLEHGLKLLIEACQDEACAVSIAEFAKATMAKWPTAY